MLQDVFLIVLHSFLEFQHRVADYAGVALRLERGYHLALMNGESACFAILHLNPKAVLSMPGHRQEKVWNTGHQPFADSNAPLPSCPARAIWNGEEQPGLAWVAIAKPLHACHLQIMLGRSDLAAILLGL